MFKKGDQGRHHKHGRTKREGENNHSKSGREVAKPRTKIPDATEPQEYGDSIKRPSSTVPQPEGPKPGERPKPIPNQPKSKPTYDTIPQGYTAQPPTPTVHLVTIKKQQRQAMECASNHTFISKPFADELRDYRLPKKVSDNFPCYPEFQGRTKERIKARIEVNGISFDDVNLYIEKNLPCPIMLGEEIVLKLGLTPYRTRLQQFHQQSHTTDSSQATIPFSSGNDNHPDSTATKSDMGYNLSESSSFATSADFISPQAALSPNPYLTDPSMMLDQESYQSFQDYNLRYTSPVSSNYSYAPNTNTTYSSIEKFENLSLNTKSPNGFYATYSGNATGTGLPRSYAQSPAYQNSYDRKPHYQAGESLGTQEETGDQQYSRLRK